MTSEETEAREQVTTCIRDVPADENRRATWSNLDYEELGDKEQSIPSAGITPRRKQKRKDKG